MRAVAALAFTSGLLAVSFCTRRSVNRASPADELAVRAAMDHYTTMLKHVASDSVAAMFTVDGEMLQANMAPIHGRAAIRAFLAPFDGHATVDSVSTSTTSLAVYGSAAYQWGTFHQVARMDGGAPGTFNGRYAAQWAKELDGQWRVVRLLMQPAPAR